MMKICVACQIEQSVEVFPLSGGNGKRSSRCRPCKQEYDQKYYLAKQAEIKAGRKITRQVARDSTRTFAWKYLLENPCTACGETDPVVLEFDHRDPSTKKCAVAEMLNRNYSIATIKAEIAKCDVLCANCHRKKTHKQFGWFSL